VEDDAVIELLAGKRLDLGDMERREIRAKLDDDAAAEELDIERVFGIGRLRGCAPGSDSDRDRGVPILLR
jgi:hypothetical protein